ncbi:MAG: hypothetical protein WB799_05825 [Candidatus Sulfotelmatobacter sp.]
MKLREIDRVVQSHATPEEPAWCWLESIPDGVEPGEWFSSSEYLKRFERFEAAAS